MADSVAQVRQVVALLRDWGFTVVEVDGWENRGSGNLTTTGRLEHHTAGAASGDAPSLRVVTFGRPGLRNSLSRWLTSRSGIIYLVARRRSWHAGAGDKGSNSTLSGTEAENTGVGEPWQPRSLEAQAAISAAECIVFGVPASRIWDHREHATPRGRKIDRTGVPSGPWRSRVAALVAAGGPTPTPAEPDEEDDMRPDERSERARKLQHAINLWMRLSGGWGGTGQWNGEPLGPLHADAHFGPRTATALWHCLARVRLRMPDGTQPRSLYLDHERPGLMEHGYLTAAIVTEQERRAA